VLCLLPAFAGAQNQKKVDSLKNALTIAKTDSARFDIYAALNDQYAEANRDIALQYVNYALSLAQKNDKMLEVIDLLMDKGYELMHLKQFPAAFKCLQQALDIGEDPKNEDKSWFEDKNLTHHQQRIDLIANIHHVMGHLMSSANNTAQQLTEYRITDSLAKEVGDKHLLGLVNMNLGRTYFNLDKADSALIFEKIADGFFKQIGFKTYEGWNYRNMGKVYLKKGQIDSALFYFHKGITSSLEQNNLQSVAYPDLADYYILQRQKDSSLFYAKKNMELLNSIGEKNLGDAYETLYKSYKINGIMDSAYKYQGLALAAKDSSYKNDIKSLADFQQLSFSEQLRLQKLEKQRAAADARIRIYILLAGIAVLLLLAGIFFRNNLQKQKANYLLQEQKEEIETQRDNLGQALAELKTTQTQLIQSEKLASLGELTAGIAHEIQNPLNFVNNFSEVNKEMVEELEQELKKGNIQEALALAADIKGNEEKINHHGKRADFIVKGMLQHSRTSTGEKQLTNINILADEFLKLSYHGLRAKDKNFNAELVTNFDENLPKVNIVQQDIGRVLLNLFNNAFYAVNQKQKTAGEDYKPEVTVSTSIEKNNLVITVKDNGNGIPDAIKDKIMQPFFTTKPTGEGTGLGLSLSYDIVVKGHGGSIDIQTLKDEYATFIITLPLL
jgi:signal transduction histidine kinase